ncbi:MAG: VOC family protein [Oscillospiraceae bacterium]|nr:VOC family protein [Oscillospiraceae bacterium]
MKFEMYHENYNVSDLDRSIAFYRAAFGLEPSRHIDAEDGSFKIVYMTNPESTFMLELTWLRAHPEKYDLGETEFHLAFRTDDFDGAHAKHAAMGCICFENPSMGIYFVEDPDGYWLEVVPA